MISRGCWPVEASSRRCPSHCNNVTGRATAGAQAFAIMLAGATRDLRVFTSSHLHAELHLSSFTQPRGPDIGGRRIWTSQNRFIFCLCRAALVKGIQQMQASLVPCGGVT